MSIYVVSMDCPHPTWPDVRWDVWLAPDTGAAWTEDERREQIDSGQHKLFVPSLETWTLDTLRMVLHELATYLPPHEDAQVTILAKTDKPKGRPRPDGRQQPRRFNDRVELQVSARGWTVTVRAWRNEAADESGTFLGRSPGEWSEPMQARLLDFAAKSPFPLASVRPVDCGDPDAFQTRLKPSRRDVLRGAQPPGGTGLDGLSRNKRIKRLIKNILGDEQ